VFASSFNYFDRVGSTQGGLIVAAGAVLLLPLIPVWRRETRYARADAVAKAAARAEAQLAAASPLLPVGPPPMWWNREGALSSVVSDAMALAARQRPPTESLTTGRVLAALMNIDVYADWQRIWLVTGDPQRIGLASAPDPADPPMAGPVAPTWRDVPLSGRLAEALWVAGRVRDSYGFGAASSGVIMLGLVAHRGNGATEALLAGRAVTHAQLLRHVQTDIIKITLPGLDRIIPGAR
jgi:hypothetical protein